jgi:hypothetical protein
LAPRGGPLLEGGCPEAVVGWPANG